MRQLGAALRDHTGCAHSLNVGLSIRDLTADVRLLHDGGVQSFTCVADSQTALGSAIFHQCATRIFGDGTGHSDQALSQSDEEFAGYATNA